MNTSDGQDTVDRVVRAIPVVLKRVLVEMKQTAKASAAHVGTLTAFAKACLRARKLERHAFDANVDLGHRMAELGLGDAEQRDQIARRQESIRNLPTAGGKTRRVAVELEAEKAKLAQIELRRGITPPEAELEYVAAVSAREALEAQHCNVALRRAAVRPANRSHALRLTAGYTVACMLLTALVAGPLLRPRAVPDHAADAAEVIAGKPATIETQDTQPATLTTVQVVAQAELSVALIKGHFSSGTGFVVRPGVVATNKHVIQGEFIDDIQVHFPSANSDARGPYSAELQYEDPDRDLAFLLVSSALAPLKMAREHAFRRGQEVIVIGNPGIGDGLVLQNAISRGVMSTKATIEGQEYYQLGISINSGNSGGPVLDTSGHVVGVVTLKASEKEGLGFCIPHSQLNVALARLDTLSQQEIASIRSKHRARVKPTTAESESPRQERDPLIFEFRKKLDAFIEEAHSGINLASMTPKQEVFTEKINRVNDMLSRIPDPPHDRPDCRASIARAKEIAVILELIGHWVSLRDRALAAESKQLASDCNKSCIEYAAGLKKLLAKLEAEAAE